MNSHIRVERAIVLPSKQFREGDILAALAAVVAVSQLVYGTNHTVAETHGRPGKLHRDRKSVLTPINATISVFEHRVPNFLMANLQQIPVANQPLILPADAIACAVEAFT